MKKIYFFFCLLRSFVGGNASLVAKTLILGLTLISAGISLIASDSFTVTNKTGSKITHLLTREKGSTTWYKFDIGSGIPNGNTVTIQWAPPANDADDDDCLWDFAAVFADGSQSDITTFDTCTNHDMIFE